MKYGQRMKKVRLARCVDQKTLSVMAQIPQSSISYIESGKYTPVAEKNKEALATSLGVSAYWLDTGRTSPFADISHTVELNACRLRNGENAAIEILKMQASNGPLSARYYVQENCFIIRCISNFVIFFLCDDKKTQEVKRQLADIFFLDDIIDDVNLKDNLSLSSCFRGALLSEKLHIYDFNGNDDAGVPWWTTNLGTLAQSSIEELLGIDEGKLEQWWQERNPDKLRLMQSEDELAEIIELLRTETDEYRGELLKDLRARHNDSF